MHAGTKWVRMTAFLGAVATVAGCVTTGQPTLSPQAGRLPATPSSSGSELRIPANTLAKGPDIPLVPVPPPPLGREDSRVNPIKPAAHSLATPTGTTTPRRERSESTIGATGTDIRPGIPDQPSVTTNLGTTPQALIHAAQKQYGSFESYIVRLTRREVVKGKMNPEELLLVKFRKRPWSVYFKWLGKEGNGREVVFVKGRHENKIHSLLAAGDIPFMPAGKRMSLAPDSILVRSACRHPITQAGIGASIERLSMLLTALEKGDRQIGTMTVFGPVNRPEFDRPVMGLEHTMPPGFDSSLPKGGKRRYFFHPDTQLPMLVTTTDERDQEVEYYSYDRIQMGVKLDNDDFDPSILWDKPGTSRTTAGR